MGLLRRLTRGDPERHEERGDECVREGRWAEARMHFLRAIEALPEEGAARRTILRGKVDQCAERLAREHEREGDRLRGEGALREATEEYRLALDLFPQAADRARIEGKTAAPEKRRGPAPRRGRGIAQEGGRPSGTPSPAAPPARERTPSPPSRPSATQAPAGPEAPPEPTSAAEVNPEDLLAGLEPEVRSRYRSLGSDFLEGYALLCLDRPAEALPHLEAACTANPTSADAHLQRGHALKTLGQTDAADRAYRASIAGRPSLAEPHLALASLLIDKGGDLQEALALCRRAREADPDDPEPLVLEGEVHLLVGDREKAYEVLDASLDVGETGEAYRALAGILLEEGDLEAARDALEGAWEVEPEELSNALSLTRFLIEEASDPARALEVLEEAMAGRTEPHPEATLLMARAYFLRGSDWKDGAIAMLTRLIASELPPALRAEAHYWLAAFHWDRGEAEIAEEEIHKASEAGPSEDLAEAIARLRAEMRTE